MSARIFAVCALSALWLLSAVRAASPVQEVIPSCDRDAQECEFHWTITKQETMVWYNRTLDKGYPVLLQNGTFYRRLPDNCTELEPLTDQREYCTPSFKALIGVL